MRRWMLTVLAAAAMALTSLGHAVAVTPDGETPDRVDVMLVFASDVSRSVTEQRFRLQRQGYAAAMTDERVLNAITSGANGRIAICFVEWAGDTSQAVVIDWTLVAGKGDAERVAERMLNEPRRFYDRTAIGAAIDFSMRQLARSPFRSDRRIIDVSGDGTNNSGRDVGQARNDAVAAGVTVNGLAILSETPNSFNPAHTHPPGGLLLYYEQNVVGGPGSFAIAAENFEAFGNSIIAKMVKEIALLKAPVFR